jgi:hypothetical protein
MNRPIITQSGRAHHILAAMPWPASRARNIAKTRARLTPAPRAPPPRPGAARSHACRHPKTRSPQLLAAGSAWAWWGQRRGCQTRKRACGLDQDDCNFERSRGCGAGLALGYFCAKRRGKNSCSQSAGLRLLSAGAREGPRPLRLSWWAIDATLKDSNPRHKALRPQ